MARAICDGVVPWPAEYAERYVRAGYWAGRTLGELLVEAARRAPDAPALIVPAPVDAAPTDAAPTDAELRLSHRELLDRSRAAAGRLRALGLRAGDRIVLQLPNGWEFVVLTLACLHAGIVPVMALPAHRRTELTHLVAHTEAAAIAVPDRIRDFDHQKLAHELATGLTGPRLVLVAGDELAADSIDLRALCGPATPADPDADPDAGAVDPDGGAPSSRDVAVLLLSGGTTGLPKLIVRTHDDYAYNALASAPVCGVDADTVYLVSLPAGHNFPLACPGILGTLLLGGRVVLLPTPEPARAFAAVAAEGVTHTAVVPAVASRWLEYATEHGAEQLCTLRVLQVGGARIADELARRVRPVLGATLQQVFGMAEGLLNYTRLDDPEAVILGTQGRPLCPDDEIRLVDECDRDVPDGEPGSLLTRGPYTPRGYYRAAEQNARAFTEDGWYRSGDICRRTPTGNLIVEGRDKDMIIRAGENVSAEEVENLVYQLPAVSQVAAVAMPDRELGERICVYVVPRAGATITLAEIRASMEAAEVARFKLPEELVTVPELPVTKVGKIDKNALRADITARLAAR
jgi:2,3-dihydroxybenzoate-AMP ligase